MPVSILRDGASRLPRMRSSDPNNLNLMVSFPAACYPGMRGLLYKTLLYEAILNGVSVGFIQRQGYGRQDGFNI